MKVYSLKRRFGNSCIDYRGCIAESIQDVVRKMGEEESRFIEGIDYVTDFITYDDCMAELWGRINCLSEEIHTTAQVIMGESDVNSSSAHDANRGVDSEKVYQVVYIVEDMKRRIENIEKYLELLQNLTESKIDMAVESPI